MQGIMWLVGIAVLFICIILLVSLIDGFFQQKNTEGNTFRLALIVFVAIATAATAVALYNSESTVNAETKRILSAETS
jgi:uncharacterized membrane-anchored protein